MHVLISTVHTPEISAPRGANVKASKVARVQSPLVVFEALSETVIREKAVMSRLILAALSGTLFALAAILTTVIDWTVLGSRNFWLAVCVTAFIALTVLWKACERF
jgi:ABC-type bacteriocin/lantibiotic exporter with double-glycine peptidase domain